jgi:hypothetical protein
LNLQILLIASTDQICPNAVAKTLMSGLRDGLKQCKLQSKGCPYCRHNCFHRVQQAPGAEKLLNIWVSGFNALSKDQADRELLWIFGHPHRPVPTPPECTEFESQETSDSSELLPLVAARCNTPFEQLHEDDDPHTQVTSEDSTDLDDAQMFSTGGATCKEVHEFHT